MREREEVEERVNDKGKQGGMVRVRNKEGLTASAQDKAAIQALLHSRTPLNMAVMPLVLTYHGCQVDSPHRIQLALPWCEEKGLVLLPIRQLRPVPMIFRTRRESSDVALHLRMGGSSATQ